MNHYFKIMISILIFLHSSFQHKNLNEDNNKKDNWKSRNCLTRFKPIFKRYHKQKIQV